MSRHREGPSRVAIETGWVLVVFCMAGTAYIGWGLETWREVVGFGLGLFATILMIGQVAGLVLERQEAQARAQRAENRQRRGSGKTVPPAEDEDDRTRRLVVPGMRPGGSADASPHATDGQLRIAVPVFRTESERAGWMDAETQVVRMPDRIRPSAAVRSHFRPGGPGYDVPGGSVAGDLSC